MHSEPPPLGAFECQKHNAPVIPGRHVITIKPDGETAYLLRIVTVEHAGTRLRYLCHCATLAEAIDNLNNWTRGIIIA